LKVERNRQTGENEANLANEENEETLAKLANLATFAMEVKRRRYARRCLVRYRKTLSKERARTKHRIKSHIYYFGIEIPAQSSGKTYWSKRFTKCLQEVKLPTESAKMALSHTVNAARKKSCL
jgi:transposase